MIEMIEWLKKIEAQASDLYRSAAAYFAPEPAFSRFLDKLAEEEEWHLQLVASVLPLAGKDLEDESLILLDHTTLQNTFRLFTRAGERLARDEMTRREMLEIIAAAEFSEWNDLFLYALHTLEARGVRFREAVAEIERHKEEIVDFFAAEPDGKRYLELLRTLPSAADKRILVIEDNPSLALFLRTILAPIGEVVLAENGMEGLSRMENKSFDVILSDTNMPVMEIYEFYQRVVGMMPEMKDRFIFFTGSIEHEGREERLEEASWISKPALITQIRQAVCDIANRDRILH
jgi:CheY-like chemotaxis protein